MTHRYMYLNSTRSSHAVEKRVYTSLGKLFTKSVALCGESATWRPEWQLSFHPTKRMCSTCQSILDWREKLMQRQYRTLEPIQSYKGKPWSLPKGSVSTGIKIDEYGFLVCFEGIGKCELRMDGVDRRTELFECIFDPTKPEPSPLPLFEAVQP